MVSRSALLIFLASHLAVALTAQQMDEYHVKAAFLGNFAKFVDWPAAAFQDPNEPLSICVLGQDPFGRALDDVVAEKSVNGHPLAVRRISDARQASACHILFVSSSERKRVLAVLAITKQPGLLQVGEVGNPTAEGMIINFTLDGGRVRFEINIAQAEEAKLHLSSKLLSLATVVKK